MIEKKSYLNMAIRLKRNFRRFYFKRILKSKIRNYNNFLKLLHRKKKNKRIVSKRIVSKRNIKFKRKFKKVRKVKKLRFTPARKLRFIKKLYARGYKKRYLLAYIRRRLESLRVKKFLSRYRWRQKKKLWKKKYRRNFKRFYSRHIKKFSGYKVRHFRLASSFYKNYGLYFFLKSIMKFNRLKYILAKYGKTFKDKKKKKIVRKAEKDRVEKLTLVALFCYNLITQGKKKRALSIFTNLFILLKFKYKRGFIDAYIQCLEKIRPLIYYRIMYISGKKYRIPVLMPISKSYSVSIRWVINNSSNGNCTLSLFNDVNSSLKNEGALIKHRKEHHLASFENKSYIRFLKFLKSGF